MHFLLLLLGDSKWTTTFHAKVLADKIMVSWYLVVLKILGSGFEHVPCYHGSGVTMGRLLLAPNCYGNGRLFDILVELLGGMNRQILSRMKVLFCILKYRFAFACADGSKIFRNLYCGKQISV